MDENWYLSALDELNMLRNYSETNQTADDQKEDLYSQLVLAYKLGAEKVSEMLRWEYRPKADRIDEVIYLLIEDKTFEDRLREHQQTGTSQSTLWESEFHRVCMSAMDDGARACQAQFPSNIVTKTWNTMMDDRVRETHDYIEGLSVPIDHVFYTFDGDYARFPGDFKNASNNANCRCWLTYSRHIRQ